MEVSTIRLLNAKSGEREVFGNLSAPKGKEMQVSKTLCERIDEYQSNYELTSLDGGKSSGFDGVDFPSLQHGVGPQPKRPFNLICR
jgi:hypothetical protein